MVEDESRLKDEDSLVVRRSSWTDQLEKDKSNWESMSNASQKSHELVKEVDFPEFNLVPPFDQICAIELPENKDELMEDPPLDKVVSMVANEEIKEKQGRDPVMTCVQEEETATETVLIGYFIIFVFNKMKFMFVSQLSSDLESTKEDELAIIAISSTAQENTAQIIISTRPSMFPTEANSEKKPLHVEIIGDKVAKLENLEESSSRDISPVIDLEPKSDEEEEEANEGKIFCITFLNVLTFSNL